MIILKRLTVCNQVSGPKMFSGSDRSNRNSKYLYEQKPRASVCCFCGASITFYDCHNTKFNDLSGNIDIKLWS